MSNETPPEQKESPPEKKGGRFRRWLPQSVAGKAAIATALVLVLTLVTVWLVRRFGPESVAPDHAISWQQALTEIVLVIAIPFVLYWGVSRWNQVIEGLYPDIDKAWQAGIDALEAQGIDIGDRPLFLVLGSASPELEHGLVHALELPLDVSGIPNEPGIRHALQWYVSPDAIYLFVSGSSSLSALMSRWTPPTSLPGARRAPSIRPTSQSATVGASASGAKTAGAESKTTSPPAGDAAGDASASDTSPGAARSDEAGGQGNSGESVTKPLPGKQSSEPYLGTIQLPSIGEDEGGAGARPSMPLRPAPPETAPPKRPEPAPRVESGGAAVPASTPFGRGGRPDGVAPFESPVPYEGTVSVDQMQPLGQPPQEQGQGLRGPAAGGGAAANEPFPSRPAESPSPGTPARSAAPTSRPTGSSGGGSAPSAAADGRKASPPARSRVSSSKVALPSALDTSDQLPRLRYVCKLLRRSRMPRCGVNGIVTLIPFELSVAGPLQLSALSQSARGDVSVIQETLGIRSPVTAVLVGLEQDRGFIELVRRLQAELLSRRLGGRFDLRSRPTPEELNTHSDRLCDAFEDWVYRLFGRDDALGQQRGNRKLYGLISRIRHELKPRLRIVLGQAFGCDSDAASPTTSDGGGGDESFFFSGCYFSASGVTTGQPAFVKGVLQDKLLEEQSQVEWTSRALRRQRLFRAVTLIGWVLAALLALLLLIRWLGLL